MNRLVAALIGLLLACTRSGAAAQPRAGTLLVIPFADVSAHSGKMPSPTAYLIARLTASHLSVEQTDPVDRIVAVTEAGDLCAQRAASGLVVGTLDLTRKGKLELPIGIANVFLRNASTFAQDAAGVTTGLIGISGVLKRTAIQARLKLYVIGCDGKLRWTATTAASELHQGNNVGAGYTQIVYRAIDDAVERLMQSSVRRGPKRCRARFSATRRC